MSLLLDKSTYYQFEAYLLKNACFGYTKLCFHYSYLVRLTTIVFLRLYILWILSFGDKCMCHWGFLGLLYTYKVDNVRRWNLWHTFHWIVCKFSCPSIERLCALHVQLSFNIGIRFSLIKFTVGKLFTNYLANEI